MNTAVNYGAKRWQGNDPTGECSYCSKKLCIHCGVESTSSKKITNISQICHKTWVSVRVKKCRLQNTNITIVLNKRESIYNIKHMIWFKAALTHEIAYEFTARNTWRPYVIHRKNFPHRFGETDLKWIEDRSYHCISRHDRKNDMIWNFFLSRNTLEIITEQDFVFYTNNNM